MHGLLIGQLEFAWADTIVMLHRETKFDVN